MYLHANAKLGLAGRLALVQSIERGCSIRAAAASFSVSPATAHRWWQRWRAASDLEHASLACLLDRSSRPARSPRRLAPELERAICDCRRKTGWGPRRGSARRVRGRLGCGPGQDRDARADRALPLCGRCHGRGHKRRSRGELMPALDREDRAALTKRRVAVREQREYTSMAVAVDLLSAGGPEVVSPELVLVDPRLAIDARWLLPDPEDAFARLEQQPSQVDPTRPPVTAPNADRASITDEEIGSARRRINELSDVRPPKPRRARGLSLLSQWQRHRARS